MFRPALAFALCAFSSCGLGLGGELLVPSTDPNTQQAIDAGFVEARDDVEAAGSNEGDVGTQDRVSPPLNTDVLPSDSGPSHAWMRPDASIDNSNPAPGDAGASVPNPSDALFLVDGRDESSGAITDAADETASLCEQLLQCCNQLMTTGAPLPVLATCFAQPWDGGDSSSCDMVLAGLSGAGFCP